MGKSNRVRPPQPLCKCGCGLLVLWNKWRRKWSTYLKGHYGKMPKPEEHKRKIRESGGRIPYKKGHIPWNKGTKGAYNEEYIKKISDAHLGNPGFWTGKNRDAETKEKISAKVIKLWEAPEFRLRHLGENHPHWRGGFRKFPYGRDWTEMLKEAIRLRDEYTCQECGDPQDEYKKIPVHHIDYDKKNCDPKNLICLCRSCHAKTGQGNRKMWESYFTRKIQIDDAEEKKCLTR